MKKDSLIGKMFVITDRNSCHFEKVGSLQYINKEADRPYAIKFPDRHYVLFYRKCDIKPA